MLMGFCGPSGPLWKPSPGPSPSPGPGPSPSPPAPRPKGTGRPVSNIGTGERQKRIRSLEALVRAREKKRQAQLNYLRTEAKGESQESISRVMTQLRQLNDLQAAARRRIVRLKRGQE